VARLLSTALLLTLLFGSAAAFALTEGLKLEKTPVFGTSVDKVFSPQSEDRDKQEAKIAFKLRRPERLTVWIERDGERVRTIVPGKRYPKGPVSLVWDGFSDSGRLLGDGDYQPVVRLSHQTIRLPNEIHLDLRPPSIQVKHPLHGVISPDGDGRSDVFRVPYKLTEPAHAILLVNGGRVIFTLSQKQEGELSWNGKLDGRSARPGNYLLSAQAEDTAGNASKAQPFAIVQVRFVALGRKRVLAKPGTQFAIRVSTDAPTVRWVLGGRTGTGPRGTLRLTAPRKPGVYTLYVSANGHAAKAAVIVA
jgi:flagellar hook assembly protein FlgD